MLPDKFDNEPLIGESDTVRFDEEIASARTKLAKEFAALRTDLAVLKWMMALVAVGVWALIMKSFFE